MRLFDLKFWNTNMDKRQTHQVLCTRLWITFTLAVLLLILSFPPIFTNSIKAELSNQEIKFTGKALGSCSDESITSVAVYVEKVILDPQPCSKIITINLGPLANGSIDRSIKQDDKVEVYGKYNTYAGGKCGVSLPNSNHYIKKLSNTEENKPPVADFTWQPREPKVKETVNFKDKSYDPDGKIVSRSWTYGDGEFGSAPNHVYTHPGSYVICLHVTDGEPKVKEDKVQSLLRLSYLGSFEEIDTIGLGKGFKFFQGSVWAKGLFHKGKLVHVGIIERETTESFKNL